MQPTREEVGRYLLERLIGRGSAGEVWEAVDRINMRRVAIKRLHADLVNDERFMRRLVREAKATARLDDPHVIPIHNYGPVDGQWIIEMRLVRGQDLQQLLRERGPLAPRRALAVIGQVASALTAAHAQQIVHRDVKPSNILIDTAADGSDFVYLADFGIARDTASTASALSGHDIVGTLYYMAPEQFEQNAEPRSDIYSLACVLYECLTGAPPYHHESLHAVLHAHYYEDPPRVSDHVPGLGTQLDNIITRALAKHPGDRQTSAVEFAALASTAMDRLEFQRRSQPSARGTLAHWQQARNAWKFGPPPVRPTPGPRPEGPTVSLGTRARYAGAALATALVVLTAAVIGALSLASGSQAESPATLAPQEPGPVSTALPRMMNRLPVPGRPETVAVSPGDGRFAYMTTADGDPGAVHTIDTMTNRVVATTPIPGLPRFVAVNPTSGNIYVSYNNNKANKLEVAGIDATTHKVVKTIDTGQPADRKFGQTWLFVFAISSNGKHIYIPHHNEATVSVLDTDRNVAIAQIPMPKNPHSVALTPDNKQALVATHASGEVDVIDTVTNTFTRAIPIDPNAAPHDVDVSPNGQTAHVVNFEGGTVSVVDIARNTVRATIPVGGNPQSVIFAADGRRSYVVDNQSNQLHTIDATTNRVTGSVPVTPGASMVALSPDGTRAYIASRESSTITTLLTAS